MTIVGRGFQDASPRQPKVFLAVAVMVLLGVAFHQAQAENDRAACVRFLSDVEYADVIRDRAEAAVEGGNGVVFVLSAADQKEGTAGPSIGRRALTVLDRGRKVRGLAASFYVSFSRVQRNSTTYWTVEEYTGGMHCCSRYHFFSKSGNDNLTTYLGSTHGTMNPPESPWVCKGKDLYFEDTDIRFVYFHTDYASSRLYIPRFYRLTPSSVAVSNRSFRDVYRDEIAEVNAEIGEKTRLRVSKPPGILAGNGAMAFSDDLGQLLVQKTILYLFARENQRAWGTFFKDVRSHYKTTEGIGMLQREIGKLLKEAPY